ncbi:hypothetical protein PUATCC27989T_00718 [Phytobacter ursingii]|nr:hypothetical protein PUATCC27989T_00718 [Phytobacter ursingii]
MGVKGQGAERGDTGHIITEHQFLVGPGRRAPVKIENAFLSPQAGEKGEVAFAILYAELTGRMGFIKGRHPVGDAVFVQQCGRDGPDILLLKDAEIPAQSGPPERGRKSQVVIHLPVVVLAEFHAGDDTAEAALDNVSLPDGEGGVLLEKILSGEVGETAGDINAERKRRGEVLTEGESHHGGAHRQ